MKVRRQTEDQPFVSMAGFKRVYDPEPQGFGNAKHLCRDCHCCQFCSDARCHACRSGEHPQRKGCGPKLSIREQIALYDSINRSSHNPQARSQEP
jgi:hypothetical protein